MYFATGVSFIVLHILLVFFFVCLLACLFLKKTFFFVLGDSVVNSFFMLLHKEALFYSNHSSLFPYGFACLFVFWFGLLWSDFFSCCCVCLFFSFLESVTCVTHVDRGVLIVLLHDDFQHVMMMGVSMK